jgi:hypothetical protein
MKGGIVCSPYALTGAGPKTGQKLIFLDAWSDGLLREALTDRTGRRSRPFLPLLLYVTDWAGRFGADFKNIFPRRSPQCKPTRCSAGLTDS